MTELRDRLLAPCAIVDENKVRGVDAGALILRLLFFEGNILDSTRLGEIPHLVRLLGVDQVMVLLKSGSLQINCDARTFGQTGQLVDFRQGIHGPVLPPGSFSFALITVPSRDEYLSGCLAEMQAELSLPLKKVIKLKQELLRHIVAIPEGLGRGAVRQLNLDLTDNRDVARASLAQTLVQAGHTVNMSQLRIELEPIGNDGYRATTNLSSLGIESNEEHSLVERALLGVGGLSLRLEQMQSFQAISGFRDEELPIFDSKVQFLASQLTAEDQAARFQRVVTLAGLPDPTEALIAGQSIDIEKLLKVRSSDECRDFRLWLRTLDQETDKDIEDRVNSLKAKVSEAFQSKTGRAIRFGSGSRFGIHSRRGTSGKPGPGSSR